MLPRREGHNGIVAIAVAGVIYLLSNIIVYFCFLISASLTHIEARTCSISSFGSAAATRSALTGGRILTVNLLRQLNIPLRPIIVVVPSSTTGRISTPASRASVKAPP